MIDDDEIKKYHKGLLDTDAIAEKKSQRQLEQLQRQRQLQSSPVKSPNYTSPLDSDVMKVKGGRTLSDVTEPITKVTGATDKIDNRQIKKISSGADWMNSIKSKLKGGAKGLKSIPILGSAIGLASAIGSGDVSAAIPGLDAAESLGPERGGVDYKIENNIPLTPEDEEQLRLQQEEMRMQALGNIKGRM
jgi:hypothetical protein